MSPFVDPTAALHLGQNSRSILEFILSAIM
jgi:hypothetical protein